MSIPLFDKLDAIGDKSPGSLDSNLDVYLASIEKEINRLLETRHGEQFPDSAPANILSYGLPENIWTKVRSEHDCAKVQ